jgi:hypothetical protein
VERHYSTRYGRVKSLGERTDRNQLNLQITEEISRNHGKGIDEDKCEPAGEGALLDNDQAL